jgi:hypothetical protein
MYNLFSVFSVMSRKIKRPYRKKPIIFRHQIAPPEQANLEINGSIDLLIGTHVTSELDSNVRTHACSGDSACIKNQSTGKRTGQTKESFASTETTDDDLTSDSPLTGR